jgi:porphyrinogen peroxidase
VTQAAILESVPPCARYLRFQLVGSAPSAARLSTLLAGPWKTDIVGLGAPLLAALGANLPGWVPFPSDAGAKLSVPATPSALWMWLRDTDRGELVHRTLSWQEKLAGVFVLEDALDAFTFRGNRDLTGYEDGTENPVGEAAVEAAFLHGRGAGLDGSSFVAVQRWAHDLATFNHLAEGDRDNIMGRRLSNNEEFAEAPAAAHVKRVSRESFPGSRFLLRRSMPWAERQSQGLEFVAFTEDLGLFAQILRRMTGAEDGVSDHLFTFSRPSSGAFYWCPPLQGRELDLRALERAGDQRTYS